MLAVLVEVPSLRVAVLATPGTRLREGFSRTIELAVPMSGAQQIHANELPGEFGAAARALASWMARADWASTPLEARLQVGLIALGEPPEGVALRLEALARKLIQQLQRWPSLAVAVHRLLLARRALPIAEVSAVSGVEPRWQPLLTACIGYGAWAPGRVAEAGPTAVTVVVAPTPTPPPKRLACGAKPAANFGRRLGAW